ncbi:PREDICTED: uncharacterized protein LOC109156476 [Ipomoea nil]|uniref:uncharacterized protein LOC109156476 n=1 Tax=Ipomoea nil TaxID=35883 RepID=UPI000901797F|nr:PREDICTED: uncharacterized protein LOC109156476 [Ipomoea nil]
MAQSGGSRHSKRGRSGHSRPQLLCTESRRPPGHSNAGPSSSGIAARVSARRRTAHRWDLRVLCAGVVFLNDDCIPSPTGVTIQASSEFGNVMNQVHCHYFALHQSNLRFAGVVFLDHMDAQSGLWQCDWCAFERVNNTNWP